MRRHRPTYTFEPYDRVPDDQTVQGSRPRAPLAWRLAYIGAVALGFALLAVGIIANL